MKKGGNQILWSSIPTQPPAPLLCSVRCSGMDIPFLWWTVSTLPASVFPSGKWGHCQYLPHSVVVTAALQAHSTLSPDQQEGRAVAPRSRPPRPLGPFMHVEMHKIKSRRMTENTQISKWVLNYNFRKAVHMLLY